MLEYTRRAPTPVRKSSSTCPPAPSNPQALDDFLDGVFDKFSDSGDLLTALVLSASPTEVKLARSSREIITITDKKVLGVVARALNDKAKPEQRIKRGSVVYIRKFGDNWEIINLPAVQAARRPVAAGRRHPRHGGRLRLLPRQLQPRDPGLAPAGRTSSPSSTPPRWNAA